MKLGMNLSAANYGQSDVKTCDVMTHATGWSGVPVSIPPYQPGSRWLPQAGAHCLPAMLGYRRAGTYWTSCDGHGVLKYADTTIGSKEFAFPGGPYRLDLPESSAKGAIVSVEANDPDPKLGLRDLSIIGPASLPGQLWHPQYVASLAPYAGGLRSYNFVGGTNDSGPGCTWESRTQRPGFGLEAMVDLCNRAHRDLYLCLPVHCLTADGLTNLPAMMGQYIGANLDPSLTVYVELGDELWNGGAGYVWQLFGYLNSLAPMLINPATGAPFGSKWATAAHMLTTSVAAMREQIPAGGPAIKSVVGGQCTWWGNSAFYIQTWIGRLGGTYDAIAPAPYAVWPNSGPYTNAAVAALVAAKDISGAIDLIVAGLQSSTTNLMVPSLKQWQQQAQIAKVPVLYYEMGLDYSALWKSATTLPAAQAFRNDPRAGALTTWYLEQVAPFADVGFWFQDSSSDVWGCRAHADDAASQVWQSLLTYAASNH